MQGHADAATHDEYIEALPEPRRTDVRRLHDLIRETVPDLEPTMDFRMLGYGPFHYRYASGREGDTAILLVASNKQKVSLYVSAVDDRGYLAEVYAERLGKASCGKSCIRFSRLDDLDLDALRELLREAARVGGAATA